jgi:hypothetical protein
MYSFFARVGHPDIRWSIFYLAIVMDMYGGAGQVMIIALYRGLNSALIMFWYGGPYQAIMVALYRGLYSALIMVRY